MPSARCSLAQLVRAGDHLGACYLSRRGSLRLPPPQWFSANTSSAPRHAAGGALRAQTPHKIRSSQQGNFRPGRDRRELHFSGLRSRWVAAICIEGTSREWREASALFLLRLLFSLFVFYLSESCLQSRSGGLQIRPLGNNFLPRDLTHAHCSHSPHVTHELQGLAHPSTSTH